MDEDGAATTAAENAEFRFHTVGEQLKAGRDERQMSLTDVAAQTRIPIRHLEALEASDFAALPGSMYSIGFAKSYARTVGLDQKVIADEMRAELAQGGHAGFIPATPDYEPADPGRVPPRWLAWTAGGVALLGLIGYFVWRSFALSPDAPAAPVAETEIAPAKSADTAAAPAAATGGAVVITANDMVWAKIYDADNKRLFEAEMKAGETFTVPADANNPMIVTGRPQALQVTVGGKPVAPLGEPDRTISDVGVSAAALLARKPVEQPAANTATTNSSAP
ncbi:MAG: RodZ domain-containing protein [Sphingorhabdus sp.]